MWDDYEDNDDVVIKGIKQLYQLRHACNVFEIDYVCKEGGYITDVVINLIHTYIHGSVNIENILYANKKLAEERIELLVDEQEDINNAKYEAESKNRELIKSLEQYRTQALGIGTRKLKIRLNKINEPIAKALRLALEIEDVNIRAKDCYGEYRDKTYNIKDKLINDLIEIFKTNGWIYGVHKSDVAITNYVIFFEIPNTEQISWHNQFDSRLVLPKYEKVWDNKINSTYGKILESIKLQYSDKIGIK